MMFPVLVCALLAAEPKGRVEGQVLHALTGEPVAKAVVTLQTDSPTQWGSARLTDASGRYIFEDIPLGHYGIHASKSGFLASFQGSRSGRAQIRPFEVKAADDARSIQIWLHPSAMLSGRVVDEDSEPMDSVEVCAWRQMSTQGRVIWITTQVALTNAAGEFSIGDLSPGTHYLSAQFQPHRKGRSDFPLRIGTHDLSYQRTFFPGVDRVSDAQPIAIKAGQNQSGLLLSMRRKPVFQIQGRFANPDGLNAEFLWGALRPALPVDAPLQSLQRFTIDRKSGGFKFFDVSPGEYDLLIGAGIKGRNKVTGFARISVGGSSIEDLVVPAAALGTVSGKVVFEESNTASAHAARSSGAIQFRSAHSLEGPHASGQERTHDDRFRFEDFLQGRYHFGVAYHPISYYVKRILMNGVEQQSNMLDIPPGAQVELEFLLSAKVAQIKGLVESEAPTGGPQAVVIIEPSAVKALSDPPFHHLDAGVDGRFETPKIPPGEYIVYAFEEVDSSRSTDPAFLKRFRDRATKVTLSEEETKSVTLRAIPASEVLSGEQP
jgi:hypothetical protein